MRKDAKDVIMNINNARYLELMEAEQQLVSLHKAVTRARDEYDDKATNPVWAGISRDGKEIYAGVAKDLDAELDAAPAQGEVGLDNIAEIKTKVGQVLYEMERFDDGESHASLSGRSVYWQHLLSKIAGVDCPCPPEYAPPPIPVGIDPAALAKVRDEYAKIRGQGMFVNIENVVTDLTALIAAAGEQVPVKCHRCHRLVTSHSPICWPCQQLIAAKFDQGPVVQVSVIQDLHEWAAANITRESKLDECVEKARRGAYMLFRQKLGDVLNAHRAAPAADKPATEPDSDRVMAQKRISERLAATRRKRQAQIELEIGAEATEPKHGPDCYCPECYKAEATPAPPTTEQRAARDERCITDSERLGYIRHLCAGMPGNYHYQISNRLADTEVRAWLDAADGKERGE